MARVLTLKIVNRLVDDSIFFLRTDLGNTLYADQGLSQPLLNSSNHDCTGGSANNKQYDCVSGQTTYYFEIESGKSLNVYANDGGTFTASVIWAAPKSAANNPANLIPRGPQRESIGEFTLDDSFMNFDVSYVDGVSSSVIMKFESADQSGNKIADVTVGKEFTIPTSLPLQTFAGYPKIFADKFTAPETEWSGASGTGLTERELAECAGGEDTKVNSKDKPQNQNLCRRWFYNKIQNGTPDNSFCNWIRDTTANGGNGIAAYCWAYDEWKCTDANCGYQPFSLSSGTAENVLPYYSLPDLQGFVAGLSSDGKPPVNVYSCGFLQDGEQGRPAKDGYGINEKWWYDGTPQPGCEENLTNGIKPDQRVPKGNGGQLTIQFVNIHFISGNSNTPSPTSIQPSPPLNPTYSLPATTSSNNTRHNVGLNVALIVGAVGLIVLIYIIIKYARSGKILGSLLRYSSGVPKLK